MAKWRERKRIKHNQTKKEFKNEGDGKKKKTRKMDESQM